MSGRRLIAASIAAATLLGVAAAALVLRGGDGAPAGPGAVEAEEGARPDWSYVIPRGTGERLDRGEAVELLPASIEARVGETIRIENRDGRGYLLGPFYVGPRETLTQRFVSPGTFQGECAVHPSGELVLVVRA